MTAEEIACLELQELEIEFLSSMLKSAPTDSTTFNYDKASKRGSYLFYPQVPKSFKLQAPHTEKQLRNKIHVEKLSDYPDERYCYTLAHLPFMILDFSFPCSYPGQVRDVTIPGFSLSSLWLPQSILLNIKKEVNNVANEHLGEITLWPCIEFLNNESYSLIFGYSRENPSILTLDLFKLYDCYQEEMPMSLLNCTDLFLTVNDDRTDVKFDSSSFTCPVCFEIKQGFSCFRFPVCGCVVCRSCITETFKIRINDGLFGQPLSCLQCGVEVGQYEARSVLPPKVYEHYESMVLRRGLDLMQDIVTCPRPGCSATVLLDNEHLGRCAQCELCFCPLCLRTYHGVEPCPIRPANSRKENAVNEQSLINERIEEEENKTEVFFLKKCKYCPTCFLPVEKSSGCNKMTCSFCRVYFCWLCMNVIHDRSNPYSHFSGGKCNGHLWHNQATDTDSENSDG